MIFQNHTSANKMPSKNLLQYKAANPLHSVWVSASAGTGKTKILTDRVLRLLISGVAFEKILCLTFTNAAASEMTHRIIKSLLDWQTNPETMERILGAIPTKSQIKKAKNLFRDLMLSQDQLSIHTIHSFCQKILQKFPFEAGVAPGFKVLSDIETKELCEKLIEEIADILSPSEPQENNNNITTSLNYILSNTHESTFNEIILEILSNQIALRDLFHQFPSSVEYSNHLKQETDTKYNDDFYIQEFASYNNNPVTITEFDLTENELALISKYNEYTRLSIQSKIKEFHKLKLLFCTIKGDPRKIILCKKSRSLYPNLDSKLHDIQISIFNCDQKIKIAHMILATCHMFEVAKYVIDKYTEYKKKLVCLDYDDLVYYTKELLTNREVKDWVLYKLDGGIMHLLVDEAQDTSPKQWQIIEAIMSEFYSGESASKEDRTVFIVGDEKQSIYSFQGADVKNFTRVNRFIKDQMLKAQKQYHNIELEMAYRSTLPILDLVTKIFGEKYFPNTKLECFRKNEEGLVELWTLYQDATNPKDLFWPLVEEFETTQTASTLLAENIARFIKNYIDSGTILPSTSKAASPKDFMILIRRRNQFTHDIISALKEIGVAVSGIDRIAIMDHLSVRDIVSITKFVLLPEDDLNLASLLRSPIFRIDDKILHNISATRRGSLYSAINDANILLLLNYFIEISLTLSAFDFLHQLMDIMDYRGLLRSANGEGTDDVLDELLNLANVWSNKNNGNLQAFVYWLEKREIEIKRDVASSRSVRVMTVHASKGLESPVVILADTTSMPTNQSNLIWKEGEFLWLGASKNSNMISTNYKDNIDNKDYEEYLRLLYVAMTRAEDHLVITGFQTQAKEKENSWYSIVSKAIRELGKEGDDGIVYYGNSRYIELVQHNCVPTSEPSPDSMTKAKTVETQFKNQIPAYVSMTPKISDLENINRILSSTCIEDFSNVKSPLTSRIDISYGSIIHKILEDSVTTSNFKFEPTHPYLESLEQNLKKLVTEKLSLLFSLEEFIKLTHYPTLRTEVSIGYMEDDILKIGRIDLVAISSEEVVIIDYKTDSKPPSSKENIDKRYIAQLKFYTDSMKKIMPNHKIIGKILWIENLNFMEILTV